MVQRTKWVVRQEKEGSNRSLEWSRRYLENRELKKLGRNKSQSSVEGNGWEQSRFSHREENGKRQAWLIWTATEDTGAQRGTAARLWALKRSKRRGSLELILKLGSCRTVACCNVQKEQ